MNTKSFLSMLLLVMFCVVCFQGHTQQVVPDTFNVFVHVNCENKVTQTLVESYMKRELRNLGDVRINSPNTLKTHTLYPVVIENQRLGTGKDGTMAMATTFTESCYPYHILNANLSQQQYNNIANDLIDRNAFPLTYEQYKQVFLTTGPTSKLAKYCKDTVAAFDGIVLQKVREKR